MRQLLFANLTTRTLSTTLTGGAFSFPELVAGETISLSMRFGAQLGGSAPVEVFPKIRGIRASIGFIDERPTRGSFAIKVGEAAISSANTTSALPFNSTAAQIKAALNAVSAGPGDFEVSADSDSYIIRRVNGEQSTLTVVRNSLFPTTFGRIFAYQVDGEYLHDLRLIQAPLASTASFQRVLPSAPVITTVQDGYLSQEGLIRYPEIQKLTLPANFRGTYQLRFGEFYRTRLLDISDGPLEIQAALNAMFAQVGPDRSVTVTNPTTNEALITFGGFEFEGVDLEELDVVVAAAPSGDPTIEISLNTGELYAAMRSVASLGDVPLEIEFDVLDESATGDDDLGAPYTTIKVSRSVNVRNPVIFPGVETTQNIDWLRNPSPRNYIPFAPGQIITGLQSYVATFGNGTNTTYSFPHNLGTSALHLTVRENGASNLRVADNTYSVTFPSANEAVLTFGTAVANDSLAVTITAAGPATVFQAHTHTISQIVGLEAILETLGQKVETIEEQLGVTGAGATAAATTLSSTLSLPPFAEIFPPARTRGTEPNIRVQLPPLPRAIYFGTAALSLGTATELPEANTETGKVYSLPDSDIYMPARSPRRGRLISSADAPFVLSDGYEWWPAERKVSGSNVFYPVEMNRTLWELAVTPEMLAPGRRLRANWSILLAMLAERPELRGVYTLRVRKGTLTSETNFGTASNVEAVTWDAVGGVEEPLFEQRLSLTRSAVIHPFDLEIARSTAGVLTAKRTSYGKTAGAPAPQNIQFILRAELARFDLENYSNAMGRPVGQVYLQAGKADGDASAQIQKLFPLDTGTGESDATELLTMSATIS
jgi:hypothetical protein